MDRPASSQPVALIALSASLRDRLWTLAQHKYGWAYANGWRDRRAYQALQARGLAELARERCDTNIWAFGLTDAGAGQVARRWPCSPFTLGTYHTPPEGWDLRDAPLRMADGLTPYIPGVPCVDCGRFVGCDGAYSYETPDMTMHMVGLEGICASCLAAETSRYALAVA